MDWNLRSIGKALRSTLRFLEGRPGSAPGSSRTAGPAGTKAKSGTGTTPRRTGTTTGGRPGTGQRTTAGLTGVYPGDFRGTAKASYAPSPNGRPEPGEVVWTWVPYEEDHSRGKDRPVLLVGNSGRYLLGLMLTSKDHDGDPRRADDYVDIGTGPWDGQGRPSEAKMDRILQINPQDVRREGAILDAGTFSVIAAALQSRHGWR
ncbi:type II toxin-antitoxin system PemK/MazF family toxin [Arthrobacter sp. PsM3]|uniref:type II toxin-antitoxin system PemK/MazF family toxin n=1 Tax=Arthrobacter sp. PsM3 TaxID=3030531 RepID=UPI00263AD31B|nr:type II toxin-antitoxin system PemK/MazF family toxin [Arthrobacter sp. PsM3]MDN4646451.1 type II toxin-antitoxin system PemK/MazF family toxin [Arthrobacter sp. PsM3]